ncbi:hypothetical protein RRF57_004872 [Xylaria bambusicola]|uniref:Uncharacterized protein n=1 Tax=Xylaria bambusicola TaxID=326684 RepID=A0AAN7UIG6_9PEZI
MNFNSTPYKSRPPPGQLGSSPFRSSPASKFRSSLVPTSRPSPVRSPNPSSKSTKTSTSARDIFRTSTPCSQRTTEFTPDLPAEATRTNAGVRKFAPRKSVSTGMSNTGSSEHFKLKIPDPDPDLTGQALAKAIPDDPTRTGSIYADQFLAHKCPAHFDELQRRQFFCILDLRRLKYAADEIFTKKDWKLNILNFAKEYEKSRSLIMLRYGLYEFKSCKPSNEVLNKWRAAQGLSPGIVDEGTARASPAKSTKRKAERELTPESNALMASTTNQNKRRNLAQEAEDPNHAKLAPFKSKRKADETGELDENKPNKQQKSTPSAATSLFASILNKTQNGGPIPSKQAASQPPSLFGISKPKDAQDSNFATKANPFTPASGSLFASPAKANNIGTPAGSVLAGPKNGATPTANTGNIFSYLSESSSGSSGNEQDDADDNETDSEPEQDSEEQDASAAVSTGTSTPPVQNGSLFGASNKTTNATNIFGDVSKPVDVPTKGGLFGRVQMSANGQPVRADPGLNEKKENSITPAKKPGDFTFNPATTPISFGQATPEVSKSITKDTRSNAETGSSESKKPASIFGASSQPSLFSASTIKSQSSETPVSIFSSQKPATGSAGLPGVTPTNSGAKPSSGGNEAPASTGLFGVTPTPTAKRSFGGDETPTFTGIFGSTASKPAGKRVFGSEEQTSQDDTATKKQAVSIFDKPATSASAPSETKLFGSTADTKPAVAKTAAATPAVKEQTPSIFDKSFIEKSAKSAAEPKVEGSTNLFNRGSNPLFGAPKDEKKENDQKEQKDNKDASSAPNAPSTENKAPSIFDQAFIAKSAKSAAQPKVEGSTSLFSRGSNPLFGAEKTNGTTSNDTKSIFDQPKTQSSTEQTSNSGKPQVSNDGNKENAGSVLANKPLAPLTATPSIFGAPAASTPAASSSTLFGAKPQEEPAKPAFSSSLFGAKAPEEPAKPAVSAGLFGAKPSAEPSQSASSNLSNSSTTANNSIFSFGSQPNTQSTSMTFGGGSTASPAVSFGASSSQPNTKQIGFQFGSPAASANATFTFGQSSPASGFTFSAGGDKQTVNNPFATSQSNSQPPAPLFGGNSATNTPSSSFTFGFGQQSSSTPQAAAPSSQGGGIFGNLAKPNGSSSFTFGQTSSGQSNSQASLFPKPAGLMNASSHLQPSGDGSTRASKPILRPFLRRGPKHRKN